MAVMVKLESSNGRLMVALVVYTEAAVVELLHSLPVLSVLPQMLLSMALAAAEGLRILLTSQTVVPATKELSISVSL